MNQYQKRKCLKGGQHHNRDIEALCLQKCCRNDRLLCFYCIHKKHENHQIIYLLQGLDSPIQKININSQISDKQSHQKYLQKKIKKINHGWKNLYRLFQSYIHKIQTNLQPQISVIQQSFDNNSAKNFAQIITNVNTPQQIIDKYVQKIKLIMKYDLSDIDKVKVSTAVAYEELKQIYKSANEQIESIMSKIVEETNIFSALDFNFSSLVKRDRGKLGIDVQNKISISIIKDKTTIDSFQNRSEGRIISKKIDNRWEQKRNNYEWLMQQKNRKNTQSVVVKQEHQSQKQQIVHQDNDQLVEQNRYQNHVRLESIFSQQNPMNEIHEESGNICLEELDSQSLNKSIQKQQIPKLTISNQNYPSNNLNILQHQQQQQQIVYQKPPENKIIQQKPKIQHQIYQTNNNYQQLQYHHQYHQQQQQQQLESIQQSSESEIIRYRNFQYSQSQHSISPQTIDLKQIYLSFHSHQQILHYLNKLPHQNYKCLQSLQISCDTLPLAVNSQIVNKIIKFQNLKKLAICQSYGLESSDMQKIVTNLTELQHLVLEQNYSLNQHMALLIKKKLTKLKKFNYTSDPLNNLFFKQQNSQFLSQVDGTTKFNAIQVLTSIPTLQTIAFQNIYKVSEVKKILQKMRKISQISIIFHQKEYKVNYVIQTLSQLPSAKNIVHIQLKQCYFRQMSLTQLISNCNALKSLVLNKCRDVTNKVIYALEKHRKSLKQLDFMQQDQITGEGFQHFQQLEILSLKACWQIQEDLLGSNIIKLTKLKCLNLNFNRYWVTQKIFDYISQLQNLQSLSIDNNKVNFNCLLKIKNFPNISTLSFGNTELQSQDIVKFFQCTKSQIRKLSLKRQTYHDKSAKKQINNQPFQGSLLTSIFRLAPLLSHLNIKGMKNVHKNHFQNLINLKCLSVDIDQLNQQTINYLKHRKVSLFIGYSHYNYQNQNSQNQISQQQELELKDHKMIKLE